MQLKRDSASEVVTAIRGLESRADPCRDNLELYSFPMGIASWAVLVNLVLSTELARQERGYKNYDVNLINLSRRGALLLRWVQEKGKVTNSEPHTYRLTSSLARAVGRGLSIAANYQVFLDCFPMWYQDRQFAELLSESAVRFTVPGGTPARRVSAFQKGFRPGFNPVQNEGMVPTAEQAQARDAELARCFYSGYQAMAYPEPLELYRSLLPSYVHRFNAMFRHGDSVDIGPYNLGEFKQGYAALATICAVHEDFCFRFGMKHEYPVNSCVVMRTRDEWAQLIARITGLEKEKCSAIIDDLTVDDRFWDLHVQPFVPVGDDVLAVAPQFPLHSRADENILRVCDHRRRSYFDEVSGLKEQEMLDDLLADSDEGGQ
jgi:hypothetical protein